MSRQGIKVLKVNSSGRQEGSTTRELVEIFVDSLLAKGNVEEVKSRDLNQGIEFIDQDWISANFTDDSARSEADIERLKKSDELVEELQAADLLVIGAPVYNFGIPAALKAWIDQVARARKTFRYSENGPVGLLENKQAVIITASGGTAIGSDIDFATPYLKHVLGFLGIHDVSIIKADQLMIDQERGLTLAHQEIKGFELKKAA